MRPSLVLCEVPDGAANPGQSRFLFCECASALVGTKQIPPSISARPGSARSSSESRIANRWKLALAYGA